MSSETISATNTTLPMGSSVTEADVGIQAFARSTGVPVTGILKQRFSDFIVREVTTSGEVVHLESIDGSALEAAVFIPAADDQDSPVVLEEGQNVAQALEAALLKIYGVTEAPAGLSEFLVSAEAKNETGPKEWIGFPCGEKEKRSAMHNAIKTHVGCNIDSSTAVVDGETNMKFVALTGHRRPENRKRRAEQWPEERAGGNYLEFTLLKENVDTMSAVNILSKHLHVKPESFAYCGTKDKRGVTAQRITVYRKKPSDFKKINTYPHNPTMRIGDFKYTKNPLKLGSLNGNRFELVLRNIQAEREAIVEACRGLETNGYINYFGLQRFGKGGAASHRVGLCLLRGLWKDAVDLLFVPHPRDRENIQIAKERYYAGEYSSAAHILPEAMNSEKMVLRQLARRGDDWAAAYNCIPKFSRLICVHAYQSRLFNSAASERISKYGLSVIVGDLVMTGSSAQEVSEEVSDESSNKRARVEDINDAGSVPPSAVHVVTQEDIDNNRFTITDVVLPLIGSETVLPGNAIGEFLTKELETDGLKLSSFATCQPVYRCRGSYRRILQFPGDLKWEIVTYTDPNAELATTEISKFRVAKPAPEGEAETEKPTEEMTALKLCFTLSSGSYATMLLRELTKQSTESDFHAALTASVAE